MRRQRTGLRQVVDVVAGGHRQRPVLTPAGDPREDQPRVDRRAVVGADAESLAGAGPEAVQQHIGLGGQVQQRLRLGLDVQVDDPLAAVQQVDVLGGHRQPAAAGAPAPRRRRGRRASSPRAGPARCRRVRSLSPRPGAASLTVTTPFFTFSTCLRSPSVAVSIAPFIARLSTKPGSGTDRSTRDVEPDLGLVPSGVSVYFASCAFS